MAPVIATRPRSPSSRIVAALSEATGTDQIEFPPLYESVDPVALDRLVASMRENGDTRSAEVKFTHTGHRVTITSDGEVTVTLEQ